MKALSARFSLWLCDVWGVIHDGHEAFPGAVQALAYHRAKGGAVILLTNSPRSAAGVELQLDQLRVPRDCYDAVVTSGDVTQDLLRRHAHGKVHLIGPKRDLSILDGLGIETVSLEISKTVLCTGLFDDEHETPADYSERLAELKSHDALMICANPDKMVRKGSRLLHCAGALADAYAGIGGRVLMAGKPFQPIYALAMATATRLKGKEPRKQDVLAIGDGPETDIKGAADFGIAAALVAGGVTDPSHGLEAIAQQARSAVPHADLVATLPALSWD